MTKKGLLFGKKVVQKRCFVSLPREAYLETLGNGKGPSFLVETLCKKRELFFIAQCGVFGYFEKWKHALYFVGLFGKGKELLHYSQWHIVLL